MTKSSKIYVVDDDGSVLDSLGVLLRSAGYNTETFTSASAFLSGDIERGSCLIADIRMPDMDGLKLLEETKKRHLDVAVIILTGIGDVAMAVNALKAGAVDFIEKPFDDISIVTSIERALELIRQQRNQEAEAEAAQQLLKRLTPREHSVLEKLVAGRSNKIAAFELGISPRTIEIHRSSIMHKVNARSLADVVRLFIAADRYAGRS